MASIYPTLCKALDELESVLRGAGLWSGQSPSEDALASTEPFACDRLLFTEWLQFIFIPRLRRLADIEGVLPEKCAVAPMAEEYFRAKGVAGDEIVRVLLRLDILISQRARYHGPRL